MHGTFVLVALGLILWFISGFLWSGEYEGPWLSKLFGALFFGPMFVGVGFVVLLGVWWIATGIAEFIP